MEMFAVEVQTKQSILADEGLHVIAGKRHFPEKENPLSFVL